MNNSAISALLLQISDLPNTELCFTSISVPRCISFPSFYVFYSLLPVTSPSLHSLLHNSSHSSISMPTISTSYSFLFYLSFPTSYILYSCSLLDPPSFFFFHTYKSHMEGLLLISACWGLHLFCLSRDPTM